MSDDPTAEILQSETLRAHGFAHGFSTRRGGVSAGPYDALNLGGAVGDDPEHVRENHRRLSVRVGYELARLHQCAQVHGAAVHVPALADTSAETWAREADALVARDPDLAVAVRVADCVPVLLASPETGHVAAVHAGWRGVAANIVAEALRTLDAPARRVIAAIGPSIGPCCFEVGEEVAAEIARASLDEVVIRAPRGNPRVDLWRAVAHQLRSLGVRSVDLVGRCTRCERESFYSFRRDGQRSGRMVGVIVARDA